MAKKIVNNKKTIRGNAHQELAGIHIYKDDHNHYVYYDVFTKNGYILNDIPKYKTYSQRFVLALMLGILTTSIIESAGPYIGLAIGSAVYILLEIKFRLFLKHLRMIPAFKRKARPPRLHTAASEDYKKIISKIVAFISISILLILLVITEKTVYTGILLYLVYAMSAGSLILAIFYMRALLFKKANPSLSETKK